MQTAIFKTTSSPAADHPAKAPENSPPSGVCVEASAFRLSAVLLVLLFLPHPATAQARPWGPAPSPLFRSALPSSAPAARDSIGSHGATQGAVVGGLVVGSIGALVLSSACDECSTGERIRAGVGGLLLGGVIGAVIGGMLGSL